MKRLIKAVALSLAITAGASALPEGPNVTHGSVNITTNGTTQTIQQGSQRAIINWNGFNIDVGELVHFIQPSSTSAVLNRVIGQDPSQILGAMRANGQVFLINPNGVIFGSSSQIDVGSLVVSTLNITDSDFLEGRLHFEQQPDKELAAVINQGTIKIDDNGFLVLTGPMVANEGLILAKVGQVALAGGTTSTVSFDPTGLLQLELPAGSDVSDGIVSLTQEAAGDLLSSVVSSSAIKAGQLVVRDGKSYLDVESGTVVNSGQIVAEGSEGQRGGRITLDSTANTILATGSILSVSGQGLNSDGGDVYVLSDGAAESQRGSLIDIGSGISGDGGFAEQSSMTGLVRATVDGIAENGNNGVFLVDPERILVENGAGMGNPPPNTVLFAEDDLEAALAHIMLVTEDGIDFEFMNGGELLLPNNINLTMQLTGAGDGFSAISFSNPFDVIRTQGTGSVTLNTIGSTVGDAPFEDIFGLNITTVSGDITISLNGGDFEGLFIDFLSSTGDITVNAPASDFNTSTRFYTEGLISVTSNSTNLTVDALGVLSGTNTADIAVLRDLGSIDMGGVDTTGGTLTVRANTVTQSNQLVTNVGTIGFDPATNSIGTALNPVRIDGAVHGGAVGDVFLESVDSLILGAGEGLTLSGTNLTGTGSDFSIGEDVIFDSISLTSIGDISQAGSGQLQATGTLSLVADSVGSFGFVEFQATELNVTANFIDMDNQGVGLTTVNATNTGGTDDTLITDGGEGLILADFEGSIGLENIVDVLTYTTTGDKDLDSPSGFPFSGTFTLVTDGAITGSIADLFNVNLSGTDVDITVESGGEGEGIRGLLNMTASLGNADVLVQDNSNNDIMVNASAAGSVSAISIGGSVDTGPGNLAGTMVTVSGQDVNVNTVTGNLIATATEGDLAVNNTGGDVNVSANASVGEGTAKLAISSNGTIFTTDIQADEVFLTATNGGSITSVSDSIIASDSIGLASGGGVNVVTETPNLGVSAAGSVIVSNTDPDLTTDINNPTGTVNLTNTGTITSNTDFSISGTQVTVSGSTLDIDVDTPDVIATSTSGGINLGLGSGGPTAVTADAASGSGNIDISSNAEIQTRNILGNVVTITGGIAGPDITSISGTITASDLTVASQGAIDIDTVTPSAFITSGTSVVIDNTGPMATIGVSAPAGPVTITNVGDLSSSTLSALSLGITADSILATGVSAPTITANATAGNLELIGIGGDVNFPSATATGNIIIDGFGNISGNLDAPFVELTGDGVNVALGANTAEVDVLAFDDIDVAGNSPDLEVSAEGLPNGVVTISNTGGNIATNFIGGDIVDISASGDITRAGAVLVGLTSLTLNADNITAEIEETPLLNVTATGDVMVDSFPFGGPFTANIGTNGAITLFNAGSIEGTLSGSQISLVGTSIDVDTITSDLFAGVFEDIGEGEGQGPPPPPMGPSFITVRNTGGVPLATTALFFETDGDINISNDGDIRTREIDGDNVVLTATNGGSITNLSDRVIATNLELTAAGLIDIVATTDVLIGDAQGGSFTASVISGPMDVLELTATATGDISVDNTGGRFGFGDLLLNDINGANVTLTSADGSIVSQAATTITGNLVTLTTQGNSLANDIDVNTNATGINATTTQAGDITINNTSAALNPVVISSSGNVDFDTTGDATGLNVSGTMVDLNSSGGLLAGSVTGTTSVAATGNSMTLDVTTSSLDVEATAGNAIITGANPTLTVEGTATGDLSISNAGDITPSNQLMGTNLTLDGLGVGDLLPSGVTLTGTSSVTVNAVEATSFTADTPTLVANLIAATPTTITGLSASMDLDLQNGGDINFSNSGDVTVTRISTPGIVTLDDPSTSNNLTTNPAGFISATRTRINGFSDIDIDTQTQDLELFVGGTTQIDNTSPTLSLLFGHEALSGPPLPNPPITLTLVTSGDLTVDRAVNFGGIALTAGGHVEATQDPLDLALDAFFTSRLGFNPSGQTLTSNLGTVSVTGSSVNANITSPNQIATSTAGDLVLNSEDATLAVNVTASATAGNTIVDATGHDLTGNLAGDLVTVVDATMVNVNVVAPEMVVSNLINNGITVTGTNPSLEFTGSSSAGVSISNAGDIVTNNIDGGTSLVLDTLGAGDITRSSGSLTGFNTTLDGVNIDAQTNVAGGQLDVTGTGTVTIDNTGDPDLGANISSSAGPVTFTNSGNVLAGNVAGTVVDAQATGSFTGSVAGTTSVNVVGTTVDVTPTTPVLTATATSGAVTINDGANADLQVGGSAVTDFDVTNTGNIAATQIDAPGTITLDTLGGGDITQASGRLVGNRAQLNGVNVTSDVEVNQIVVMASNDITINSFLAGLVSPVDLDAGRDVSFTSVGDALFTTLTSGRDITLDIGGSLTGVGLSAPGIVTVTADTITLDVSAAEVFATARTGNVSLSGSNPAGITVGGSAVGDFLMATNGTITANAISAADITLISTAGDILQGTGPLAGTLNGTATVSLDAAGAVGLMGTPLVTATSDLTALSGDGNLFVSNTGDLTSAIIDSVVRDVTLTNTGNVSGLTASGAIATVTATGSVSGDITANTGTATASGTSVTGTLIGDTQVATATTGDLNITSIGATGSGVDLTATASSGTANLNGSGVTQVTGTLTANLVNLDSFDFINVSLVTPEVVVTNLNQSAILNGSNPNLEVTAAAPLNLQILNAGNILLNDISAQTTTISTLGAGDITRVSGDITAEFITLFGGQIGAAGNPLLTDTNSRLAVTGSGDIFIDNAQAIGTFLVVNTPGDVVFNNTGDLIAAVTQVNGANVDVTSTGAINADLGGSFSQSVTVQGTDVVARTNTPDLDATATAGSVVVEGSSANMAVSGSSTDAFTVNNTGNIAVGGPLSATNSITLDTSDGVGGPVSGNITTQGADRLLSDSVTLNAINIGATGTPVLTQTDSLFARATGDLFVANFVTDPVTADLEANNINFSTEGGVNFTNLLAGNGLTLDIGGTVAGSLTANAIDVTGTSVNIDVVTSQITATSTAGGVTVTGTNPSLTAILSATGGPVDLTNDGDITVTATADQDVTVSTNSMGSITANQVTGDAISLNAGTGNISQASGSLVGNSVDLVGATISSVTQTGLLTAAGTGDVNVTNTGDLIGPPNSSLSSSGGNVTLNNTGNVAGLTATANSSATVNATGSFSGNVTGFSASVSGTSVSGNLTGPLQSATATAGDINLTTTSSLGQVDMTASATGTVNLNGAGVTGITGSTTGSLVTFDSFDRVSSNLVAPEVVVTNLGDFASFTGASPNLEVTIAAAPGNIQILNSGNILLNDLSGANITLRTLGAGDITRLSGQLSSPGLVQLDGNQIGTAGSPVQTSATGMVLTATGDVFVDNAQAITGPAGFLGITTGGDVTFNNNGALNSPGAVSVSGSAVNVTSTGAVEATLTGTNSVTVQGTDVVTRVTTPSLSATATAGSVSVTGNNANLGVNGSAADAFTVNNTGNIAAGPINATNSIDLDTSDGVGGAAAGDITQSSGRLIAPSVTLNGINVGANTQTDILIATATQDLIIENFVTDPTDANLSANNLTFTTGGDVNFTSLVATNNLSLNLGRAITGTLTANVINVTGTLIDLDVTANEVEANATAGDVNLTGTNANLQVAAGATGNVTVNNTGNLALNAVQGNNITVGATGNISDAGSNSFTGNAVSVNGGGSVTVGNFAAGSVDVSGTNDVQVGNLDSTAFNGVGGAVSVSSSSGAVTTGNVDTSGSSGTGGSVSLSASTNLTAGTIDTSSVNGDGGSVALVGNSGVTTGAINTSAPAGSGGTVTSTSASGALNHGNITTTGVTGGDVTMNAGTSVTISEVDTTGGVTDADITASGDVTFARIVATNVNIDTDGDVTDTSNTIIAENIGISGNNITVNTQGTNIDIFGLGLVDVTNSGTVVNSLNISGIAGIIFNTSGGVSLGNISSSSGNVAIVAGGNIGQLASALVSGGSVSLTANGTITPNVGSPLQVNATSSITISAQGSGVAGAIAGTLGSGSVTVAPGSGTIFYNGVQLNGFTAPDTPLPPEIFSNPAENVLGQEGNQTVDDGSEGTAANDGIVEKSPTEKLVAQLMGGSGEDGAPTEFLITLQVDELGQVKVSLASASPYDTTIDTSEDMSADDVLELDTDELTEVKVKVLYDPAKDQLVLAIDLSADDIIDLEMEDFQEIPVDMTYTILGDAELMRDALQADDIIDLDVEDLGTIPIRVIFTGGGEEDGDFLEIGLQELMEIPLYVGEK